MKTLVIARAARADLKAIGRYTEREWGLTQRERYLALIRQRFARLLRHAEIGAPRSELGPGYRSLPCESHVIYYRIRREQIFIVRILHNRMDAPRHLNPKAP